MKVAGRWHVFLGRAGEMLLSHTLDATVYGLDTGDGLPVFDAGAGVTPEEMREAFRH